MEQVARVAGIADVEANNLADPTRDIEFGTSLRRRPSSSRVSLPLSHRRSFSSTNRSRATSIANEGAPGADRRTPIADISNGNNLGGGDDDEDEELPWGPEHPCFPHLNPHVPKTSPLYESTRVVRIRRDWLVAGDLAPTFTNVYPEVLDPLILEDQFHQLVSHINETLVKIFDPYRKRNWVDVGIGALTGWLWDDFGLSQAKKDLAILETWIASWSTNLGSEEAVRIMPLRQTGYLSIDIQIPDPKLEMNADDGISYADTESRRDWLERRSLKDRASSIGRRSTSIASSRASRVHYPMKPRDEKSYGAQPVVPPIPNKFLDQKQ